MARTGRWALALVGVVGTLALASLVFVRPRVAGGFHLEPRFDLGAWVADLPAHARWLVPFALLAATLPAWRALAWRYTLPGGGGAYADRYHAVAIGALVQNVLPGHLGPLGSAIFLGRRTGRPFGALFASFLVLKWLELAGIVAAAWVTAAWPSHRAAPPGMRRLVTAGVCVCLVLAVALVLVARLTPGWIDRLERRGRLLRFARLLDSLVAGLGAIGSIRRLTLAGAVALLPVLASGLAYGIALRALGAAPGVLGGWSLLAAITLAQVTPGLAIGAGVTTFVCAWGARELGVAPSPAAALAVLSNAATGLVNVTVGAVSALVHRRELAALRAWRRAHRGGAAP